MAKAKKGPSKWLDLKLTPKQEKELRRFLDEQTGGLNVSYTKSTIENGKLKLGYVACNPQFSRRSGDPT